MNLLKKGFLSLSLISAGILLGSIQEPNTEVIIKNESRYKLMLKKVLFYHHDGSERAETLTIGIGEKATFNPWYKDSLPFEYLRIMNSPEQTILTKRPLERNKDKSALVITIKSGWFGGWDDTQQWQESISAGDFTEL